MNSSNTASDQPIPSYDYEVDISLIAEVVGATGTADPSPKYPPGPPVNLCTTMVINVL